MLTSLRASLRHSHTALAAPPGRVPWRTAEWPQRAGGRCSEYSHGAAVTMAVAPRPARPFRKDGPAGGTARGSREAEVARAPSPPGPPCYILTTYKIIRHGHGQGQCKIIGGGGVSWHHSQHYSSISSPGSASTQLRILRLKPQTQTLFAKGKKKYLHTQKIGQKNERASLRYTSPKRNIGKKNRFPACLRFGMSLRGVSPGGF